MENGKKTSSWVERQRALELDSLTKHWLKWMI